MADAMVDRTSPQRFFCHRCRVEFQHVEQEYICPYCEGGFIEELDREAETIRTPSEVLQDYSDADMSTIDEMNIDDLDGLDDSDDFSTVPQPILNDLAFLMSGGRIRATFPNFGTGFTLNNPPNIAQGVALNVQANVPLGGVFNIPATLLNSARAHAASGGTAYGPTIGATVPPPSGTAETSASGTTNVPASGTANAPGTDAANGSASDPTNGPTTAPTGNSTDGAANNPENGTEEDMTEARRRGMLIEELVSMFLGGRPPVIPGMNPNAPFVLVGTPGDYVFGGDGLDAVVTQLLGQLEHSGPPPLPAETLAALPTEEVTEEQAATNTACSVCWENFQQGETVTRLECEHIFHKTCITPWLELHATCPICRRSLIPPGHPILAEPPEIPTTSATSTTTAASATTATTATTATFTPPTASEPQHIRLRAGGMSTLFVNTSPHIVIQRRGGGLPTVFRRFSSQSHTWDNLNDTSTSGSMSPASSVTAGGFWAMGSSNSTGSTNSSSSLNSNDRDRQYNMDIDYD